jgi:hypothetical protein
MMRLASNPDSRRRLTKFTSIAAPLAAHSVTSAMRTHALQICEPNMSTIAAAERLSPRETEAAPSLPEHHRGEEDLVLRSDRCHIARRELVEFPG